MSIDLALQPWPSLITAAAAFCAVLLAQWVTHRGERKKRATENLKWIVGLLTSENKEARRIGVALLEEQTDAEKVTDEDVQRQALVAWQAYLEEDEPPYDEKEDEIVVDPDTEA